MFTGLIEEVGIVTAKQALGKGYRFTVSAKIILSDLAVGDSVSIDGVCQTVVALEGQSFAFETVEETVKKTTLGQLSPQAKVNLERALAANARLGGHFVLGHVDCTGKINSIKQLPAGYEVEIQFPSEYAKNIVPVGSIAVDGVSLTVAELRQNSFKIAVIPHTWKNTSFADKRAGDLVNLEFDVLGKYVERMLNHTDKRQDITEAWLREKGF